MGLKRAVTNFCHVKYLLSSFIQFTFKEEKVLIKRYHESNQVKCKIYVGVLKYFMAQPLMLSDWENTWQDKYNVTKLPMRGRHIYCG